MKVTVVCDVLGEENNGTTVAAMNLIRHLKSKGHELTVVCPDEDRRGEEGFVCTGIRNLGPLNGYVRKNGVTLARVDRRLLRAAVSGSEVIHLLTPFPLSWAAIELAEELNIPVTASFHCQAENFSSHVFMKNSKAFNRGVYKVFYKKVFSHCAAVHYPTEFIRRTFEESVGYKTNAYVISNGVNGIFTRCDCERPEPLRGKKVVVFSGRYSPEKRHDILIKAAALSRYKDELQLVFAGAGPLKKKLSRQAERCGILPPIFSFFSRPELVKVLNTADLYVHPAEIEIEAISCLEAISCGLVPVISDSERSATKYFAIGEDNLFRVNDPEDLARKMDFWLSHPEEKERCRNEYAGFASTVDQLACMNRMEQMLLDAASGGTKR